MKTTRMIIRELASEYLASENYHRGWIDHEWIERVSDELNLTNLSDLELSNMWDMVDLTLQSEFFHYYLNEDVKMSAKYQDVRSAFTEVVNREARRRG